VKMPDSIITKKALSESLKNLMEEEPLEKITIARIVTSCHMNRQSFYYHFKDKYDLVNWIFYTEFFDAINEYFRGHDDEAWSREILDCICAYFYRTRDFYQNALKVTGQNSFSEYFQGVVHQLVYKHIKATYGPGIDYEFYATFFTDAVCMSIIRWISEGCRIPPEKYVTLIKNVAVKSAEKIIEIADADK